MFLKSIKLHNIRSYEDEEINFPSGSVLLAGDIGSGKSTILIAVEFALFGVKKGDLPGFTLLRHGKREGSIELRLQIDNKDVIIKRNLKLFNNKTKDLDSIKQEAGYVIINSLKEEGTAEELRSIILDLLGYPKNLLRKGKDLIYRYTVYTPQEDMKQILYENNESRLNTLRNVFNIDKYKNIKENSKIIIGSLRDNKKKLEGFIIDLESRKIDLEERKKEVSELDQSISRITPTIQEAKNTIKEKKVQIANMENDIVKLNRIKNELSVTEANLVNMLAQNKRLKEEEIILEKNIADVKKELETYKLEELLAEINAIKKKIEENDKWLIQSELDYRGNLKIMKGYEAKIEHSNQGIKEIQRLDICPLCMQKVDETHKHEINLKESAKCLELNENLKTYKEKELLLEKRIAEIKKELDLLRKRQNDIKILNIKFGYLNEKIDARSEKSQLKEKMVEHISFLVSKKTKLILEANEYSQTEEKYRILKKNIDELLLQERFLELEESKYRSECESIKKFILKIEKEIIEKQKAKESLASTSQLINWISEFFVELMSTIERHVMVNIHSEFNDLFKKWFDFLIEDETINVRIDENFTPIIEQDGYETYIENLSGGEKTSVALSYRLALNKVINDIVVGIHTKGIIMLDEPTDGFSTEQLDKVREVLDQLELNQIIIVSHESKIEGFVSNIIRIEKHANVSHASSAFCG